MSATIASRPRGNGSLSAEEAALTVATSDQAEDVEDGLHIGRQLVMGLGMLLAFTVVTGFIYPLFITGIAQVAFKSQANGSMVTDSKGQVVGSLLQEQVFTATRYFYSRPSAAGTFSGNGFAWASDNVPDVSGGSNLGPTNARLVLTNTVQAADAIRTMEGLPANAPVPVDLATTSASGLDPDITPAAAKLQVPRVATARGMSEADLQKIVDQYTQGRDLGFMGEPRVNVLKLNLALDNLTGGH